jgi:hypothetical protein
MMRTNKPKRLTIKWTREWTSVADNNVSGVFNSS